jgi:chorismate mutase
MNNDRQPILIAGPCAAESREQVLQTAAALSDSLAGSGLSLTYFRTGVWKWRSTPSSFGGAGKEALSWLQEVKQQYGFQPCVEVACAEHVDLCIEAGVTTLWIGSRTAVNPYLVQEIAEACQGCPLTILVKNPVIPDLKLWMGEIERFKKMDVRRVLAVHRGFADRSESVYRNAPCWEIPIELKVRMPEIPLLCDPSHIAGDTKYIAQIAQIALDYGYSGLMLESHIRPAEALSDAQQQLRPDELVAMLQALVFKTTASSPAENALRKQRNLLENIDVQMADLLAKRMQIVDAVADIKEKNNLPIVQPKQWGKVEKIYRKASLEDADYEEFLSKFLELLHNASIRRQQHKK